MMTNENNMILEVWELLKEFTIDKQRADAAVRLLRIMDSHDMSDGFSSLRGEDRWLDDALIDYVEDQDDDEEIEEDE